MLVAPVSTQLHKFVFILKSLQVISYFMVDLYIIVSETKSNGRFRDMLVSPSVGSVPGVTLSC